MKNIIIFLLLISPFISNGQMVAQSPLFYTTPPRTVPPIVVQQKRIASNSSNLFSFDSTPTDGNLLILVFGTAQAKAVTVPVGWTLFFSDAVNLELTVAYKIASTELNSYTFAVPGTYNANCHGFEVSSYNTTTPLVNMGFEFLSAVGAPWIVDVPNSHVSVEKNALMIAYIQVTDQLAEPTFDNGFTNVIPTGAGPRSRSAYRIYNQPATSQFTNVTYDSDRNGINSIMLKVNPRRF